jgi:hypothetical protein
MQGTRGDGMVIIIFIKENFIDPSQLQSKGDLNHLMSRLTPEPYSTGGENKKK